MAEYPCSGVILAGGQATRFGGADKAALEVAGRTILDRLLDVLTPLLDEIILVTTRPEAYLAWDVLIVSDHFEQRSSLNGIHAGLFAARHPHVLVTACDMPFVQPGVLQLLLEALAPRWDVIVPVTAKGSEPLLAIYSKRCLPFMEAQLARGRLRIKDFFDQVKLNQIAEQALLGQDPEMVSFFNVNSPTQLAQAEAWLRRQAAPGV